MDKAELTKTHPDYAASAHRWPFFMAAYEGVESLKGWAIKQHKREDKEDYDRRLSDAVGFNYSQSIVGLLNYYLFQKPRVTFELAGAEEDKYVKAFLDDADLNGSAFDPLLVEASLYASIKGHVGLLVDMPQSKAQEARPYVSVYHPEAILDWRFSRNEATHKPELTFLKLQEADGVYVLWTPQLWQRYVVERDEVRLDSEGLNALGLIPFVWLLNKKTVKRCIGGSDLSDIAPLDASIIRDLSHGAEIITLGAFPMFAIPRGSRDPLTGNEVKVGPTAVQEIDPALGDAQPHWIEAKVKEPLDSILAWVARKTEEIYRISNAGGLQATESSRQTKSGTALRQEFQILNAVLAKKATSLEEAERMVFYYVLLWLGKEAIYDAVKIERPKSFAVEDLSADLANAVIVKALGADSKTLKTSVAMWAARSFLPPSAADDLETVEKELQEAPDPAEIIKGYSNAPNQSR